MTRIKSPDDKLLPVDMGTLIDESVDPCRHNVITFTRVTRVTRAFVPPYVRPSDR